MWIQIREAFYPGEGLPDDHPLAESGQTDYLVARSSGCGCCAVSKALTPELLQEAIEQAKAWLAELEAIDPSKLPCRD